MNYGLKNHDRVTAVQEILISLLPDEEHGAGEDGEELLVSEASFEEDRVRCHTSVVRGGVRQDAECVEPYAGGAVERRRALTHAVKQSAYEALLPFLPQKPAWGAMTGVKPAKPVRLALQEGLPPEQADSFLHGRYDVEPRRSVMAAQCAKESLKCLEMLQCKEVQLYVGIPFCPAKCRYCSFVSNDVTRFGHLVEPYLAVLHEEITAAGRSLRQAGGVVGSLYIGGGTPTTLSATQLNDLLSALHGAFDLSGCREITVEAGRPETISREKLSVCAQWGVVRVSVNPQTMHDDVLRGVGRFHTAEDIRAAYRMVRQSGDFCVNMDLIAGLPGDDAAGLTDSVRQVAELQPENITLHCLALKKGAPLRFGPRGVLERGAVDQCHELLDKQGYRPYYLYRQKYIAGGLENVGFCRDKTESFYNVCMMEELGSVIALGASGVTKLCDRTGRNVKRFSNPKYPTEYISSRERIAARAVSLLEEAAVW